jgi:hypothetical protein
MLQRRGGGTGEMLKQAVTPEMLEWILLFINLNLGRGCFW